MYRTQSRSSSSSSDGPKELMLQQPSSPVTPSSTKNVVSTDDDLANMLGGQLVLQSPSTETRLRLRDNTFDNISPRSSPLAGKGAPLESSPKSSPEAPVGLVSLPRILPDQADLVTSPEEIQQAANLFTYVPTLQAWVRCRRLPPPRYSTSLANAVHNEFSQGTSRTAAVRFDEFWSAGQTPPYGGLSRWFAERLRQERIGYVDFDKFWAEAQADRRKRRTARRDAELAQRYKDVPDDESDEDDGHPGITFADWEAMMNSRRRVSISNVSGGSIEMLGHLITFSEGS